MGVFRYHARMMKLLRPLAALCALGAGVVDAAPDAWNDPCGNPDAPYLAPVGDDGLGYDAGLGVDPVYSTPTLYEETGRRSRSFIPNEMYLEFLGNMEFNGKRGHVQVTNAVVSVPLVNPGRVAWRGWHLDVRGTARFTWLDCKGRNLVDEDNLYTLGAQATVSRVLGPRARLQLGVTPQFSTDFDLMSHHNVYVGGYVAFSMKANENLRYTLGVAYMPDYYRSLLLPVLSLQWRCHPAWELRVEGARLAAVCVADERFHFGPFFQWNTAVWTVHRQRQTQQLRMSNCIAGFGATYDHKLASGSTLGLLADVGLAFNNIFRIRDARGDDTLEKYRAHPGFYGRVGFRFSF